MPVSEASSRKKLRTAATSHRKAGSSSTSRTHSPCVSRRVARCTRSSRRRRGFRDVGVRVRILWPGEPNALYHSEGVQEGFLVLSGECTLIVEEEERPLRPWDYFHCPSDTRHIIVGAGDGPCAILMLGARPEERVHLRGQRGRGEVWRVRREGDRRPEAGPTPTGPANGRRVRLPWPLDSDVKALTKR